MNKQTRKLIRKTVRLVGYRAAHVFAVFSLLFNSSAPFLLSYNYVAYADDSVSFVEQTVVEEEVIEESVVEETTEVTEEVVVEEVQTELPAVETEPTPTEEIQEPLIDETVVDASTPIADVLPEPEVLGAETVAETTEAAGDILPEGISDVRTEEEVAADVLGASTEEVVTTNNENLETVVLANTNADSVEYVVDNLDLSAEEIEESDPSVITDKADYAPTDAAVITGTGFKPNYEYTIIVSSQDDPATSAVSTFTTESDGSFVFVYQLDGTYRPNYEVEIYDGDTVVAKISFTDSPISGTTVDSAGANDEPGQKDLTKMSVNYAGLPTSINVTWNWDEKGPGGNVGGNTGDACSLFDTDGDGLVNYALCVIIDGDPSIYQSQALYSCSDAKADRCTNPATISAASVTSTCTANTQGTDPFAAGANYPTDSVATCTVNMSDVGGAGVAELIDVCSYPSQQPNSDPSDCIVFKDNTGRLEVIKDLIPSDNLGKFNLQIDAVTQATDVGDAGTTGEKVVNTGNRSVGEIAGTGTSLASYGSTIVCKDLNGQGATIASGTNSGPLTVAVAEGDDIVCTITNTLLNGTVVVHKDVQGPTGGALTDTSQNFTVQLDGANSQLITDAGTVTYTNVVAGSHTVTESVIPSGYSLFSMTPDSDALVVGAQIAVVAGQTTDVYLINRQQNATVTIHKNVVNPDGGEVSDSHSFTARKDGGSDETIAEGTDAIYSVVPGTYTFTEVTDTNYTLDSITGDNDANAANGATLTVVSGGSAELTFVNKQKKATITVIKDVLKSDGSTVDDNNTFEVTLNGETKNFSENSSAVFSVNPGTYSAVESAEANYSEFSNDSPETVSSNGQGTILIANKQDPGSVSGYKFKADELTGISGWTINLYNCVSFGVDCSSLVASTTTDATGFYSFTNLLSGFYLVSEDLTDTGYTPVSVTSHDITINPGTTSEDNNFSNFKNIDITVCKVEDADGNIQTVNDRTPVAEWQIDLIEDADTQNPTTGFTGEDGCYKFENLGPAQNYSATEITQAGWTNLTPVTHDFGAPQDGVNQTYTFVNFQNVSISGAKFSDPNHNGIWDNGESALSDWTINLSGAASDSDVTNADGLYSFSNLGPGTYTLSETLKNGWEQTYPANPNTHTVIVSSGQNVTNLNFGNFEILPGLVSAKTLTSLATAVEGDSVTFQIQIENTGNVTLYNPVIFDTYDASYMEYVSTNPIAASTHSTAVADSSDYDEDGDTTELIRTLSWVLPVDLAPGEFYTITLTFTAIQYTDDIPETTYTGNEAYSTSCLSDTSECSQEDTIITDPTVAVVDIDALGSVSGFKFLDSNGDGQWGEEGVMAGVTINLYDAEDNLLDTTVTAFDGSYSFDDLATGDYKVCETVPAGYVKTYPTGCHEFSVTDNGGSFENQNFGNFELINISGYKFEDVDGDGIWDVGEPALSGWSIWLNGDGTLAITDANGFYGFTNLGPGNYTVAEELQTGWIQTAGSTLYEITAESGVDSLNNNFGNFQKVTVTVCKLNDIDGNPETTEDQTFYVGWPINLLVDGEVMDSELTSRNGCFRWADLENGHTYGVSETQNPDWHMWNESDTHSFGPATSGQEYTYTFINSELTDIHGYKWNDLDGNGQRDYFCDENENCGFEPLLGGWRIFIDADDNGTYDDGEQYMFTESDGEHLGWYWFENLLPGNYVVCEEGQNGWVQTFPTEPICHNISVPFEGEEIFSQNGVFAPEHNFGNNQQVPVLFISKTNNHLGDQLRVGDDVVFTLTLRLEDADMENVVVTDLLPRGFTFDTGSWSAVSSLHGVLGISQPSYASPGDWNLGNMSAGEVITMTYTANIENEVDPGLYKDLAFANGDALYGTNLLALAEALGNIGDLNFVGTETEVVIDPEEVEAEVKETQTEEVLGASTELPATGANTNWLYAVLIMTLGGLVMYIYGRKSEKKSSKVLVAMFMLSVALIGVRSAFADVSPLIVRFEDPETSQVGDFNITFVTMDTEGRAATAKCYKQGPSDGGFVQFGSDIAISAGGNTANCVVNGGVATEDGDYKFKVSVFADADEASDETGAISIDTSAPNKPKWITKDKINSCKYEVELKTANDGQTASVEVYRDDDKNIEANAGSLIKTIVIGPDQKTSFEDELSGDCDRPYYAVRAFDSHGVGSGLRTEEIETTNTITEEPTTVTQAIATSGGGSQVGGDTGSTGGEEGSVLGESTPSTEVTTTTDESTGAVSGVSRFLRSLAGRWWFWLLVLLAIFIARNAKRKRNQQL